jgi:alpha-beta hydrolase superfamily lysophospholipase
MEAPQEEVVFQSGDGIAVRGWWVDQPGSKHVAVLCHGYLMCRSELTPLAVSLWREGYSCLLIDFRAHGKSGGNRCGFGLREIEEVLAAVDFARARKPDARVALIGSSMGAAACALALQRKPDAAQALVLDSCYSRLAEAVGGWWRFLGGVPLSVVLWPCVWLAGPLAGMNPRRVDVARALKGVDGRGVLLLHGTADNLALPKYAKLNAAACDPPAEVVWFDGCGHSEGRWNEPERYRQAVLGFLADRLGR